MDRDQVIDLLAEIKQNYPSYDVSDESIERHYRYLRDIPFDVAMQNVEEHIKTERFPPTIADIRGRLGDQMEAERSKQMAREYMDHLEEWRRNAVPPPPGMMERIRAMLQPKGEGA